ncbi:MAG: TolC family protein, partial [Bacteroidaceae bacterium]
LKLPPLDVLYVNAEKVPVIEIAAKQRLLAERLLKKEKKGWLNFISIRGGYAYGKTDNYGSRTDVTTPLFYQYTGMSQHYYNVGGNISIPLETLFDLGGKVKRQKIEVEIAEANRLKELDMLKQEIAKTYIQILANIAILKIAAESVTLSKGEYKILEEKFSGRRIPIEDLALSKKKEMETVTTYEQIKAQVNIGLLNLEILSNTPIISK